MKLVINLLLKHNDREPYFPLPLLLKSTFYSQRNRVGVEVHMGTLVLIDIGKRVYWCGNRSEIR
jgi:hypothetical protein